MQNRRTLAKTHENMTFSSTAPPLPWKTTKKHASNARRRPAQTQTHRSDSAVLENVVFPHVSAWTFSFCSYFSYPLPPHEPTKPSPMYYHGSPPRCDREQCITQATEPRGFASTTPKHLKAISRHKTSPMTCHDFTDTITVFLTPCATWPCVLCVFFGCFARKRDCYL